MDSQTLFTWIPVQMFIFLHQQSVYSWRTLRSREGWLPASFGMYQPPNRKQQLYHKREQGDSGKMDMRFCAHVDRNQ